MHKCPYVGLVPFAEGDARYFFGREKERRIIADNLRASRLTVLYGESGVGKTSVLNAGVAYHLRSDKAYAVAVFSEWRADSAVPLARAIEAAGPPDTDGQGEASDSLIASVRTYAARNRPRLLLILDQFEDYFQYQRVEAGLGRELAELLGREDMPINCLISIREDSLALIDNLKGKVPNVFDNRLRIDFLTPAAAVDAVVEPIRQLNEDIASGRETQAVMREIDRGLAQRVVDEILQAQGGPSERVQTPYLQQVMSRWWEREVEMGSSALREQTLADLGGVKKIVDEHLQRTIADLAPEEQDIAAAIFGVMVTSAGRKIAQTVLELAGSLRLMETDVGGVLEKLRKARVVAGVPSPRRGAPADRCYEFAHDVVAKAALDWRTGYQAGKELEAAQQQAAMDAAAREKDAAREREVIQARVLAQEQAQRAIERSLTASRLRWVIAGLVVMFAIALGAALLAWHQQQEATAQEQRARLEQRRAQILQQAAENSSRLARQRLDHLTENTRLKLAVLYGTLTDEEFQKHRDQRIDFQVQAVGHEYKSKKGDPTYTFSLSPIATSIPGGLKTIAFITYRFAHPTFPNTLITAGPDRSFRASYDGVGCLQEVSVFIEYADPDRSPGVATIAMCQKLGW